MASEKSNVGEQRAENPVSLATLMSKKSQFFSFSFWIVGQTPLIVHAWSEKARREMLSKQLKAVKGGKDVRDPQADFVSSLYETGDGGYGFPAMGVKNCLMSAAHKDRGIARSAVMGALWIDAELVRVRPATNNAAAPLSRTASRFGPRSSPCRMRRMIAALTSRSPPRRSANTTGCTGNDSGGSTEEARARS